jgi:hypothetical protein
MNYKDTLLQYTMASKALIYHPQRAMALIKMMGSKVGTISAVHAVMAGIDRQKPVPPEIAPFLAVVILMLLVSLAQRGMGATVPKPILDATVKDLMTDVHKAYPLGGPKQAQAAPQAVAPTQPSPMPQTAPVGLINQGAQA